VYRAKRARDKDNQMNAFVLVLSLTQKLHFCLILKKRFKQVSFHTKDCSAGLRELTRVNINYFWNYVRRRFRLGILLGWKSIKSKLAVTHGHPLIWKGDSH